MTETMNEVAAVEFLAEYLSKEHYQQLRKLHGIPDDVGPTVCIQLSMEPQLFPVCVGLLSPRRVVDCGVDEVCIQGKQTPTDWR